MSLYVGSSKVKVSLEGKVYTLNLYSSTPIINGVVMLSSDGYILKDLNNLYITAKESE